MNKPTNITIRKRDLVSRPQLVAGALVIVQSQRMLHGRERVHYYQGGDVTNHRWTSSITRARVYMNQRSAQRRASFLHQWHTDGVREQRTYLGTIGAPVP